MVRPCAAWVAGVVLALGCGDSGPRKYDVSGTIKYDNVPLEKGEVVFTPENKTFAPQGGPIKDGRYTVRAVEGVNKVEVTATRTVPGKKGPMGEDFVESVVPDKYGKDSTLKVEVGSGKTEHNLDLPK